MVLAVAATSLPLGASLVRDASDGLYRLAFRAMGTRCAVAFSAPNESCGLGYARAALDWTAAFERRFSRFLPDSIVSTINGAAGGDWVELDAEADHLLDLCHDLNFATEGLFDATALPLIELWDYNRSNQSLPSDGEVEAAKRKVGWAKVQRRAGAVRLPEPGMRIDFGGFGKEYATDRVAELRREFGIGSCLVDFGQDIRACGSPPDGSHWRIGLEDPSSPGSTWTTLALNDGGVATSGDYQRFFVCDGKRYGHILDPRSGRPADSGLASVSVVASTCLEAGTLSTVAFVAGVKKGMELIEANYGAEGCFVGRNEIWHSSRFYEYAIQL